jgi:protoporphyrinogen oxidase
MYILSSQFCYNYSMKIAVLGGGLTGLTASYYLAKKNHRVNLFEKEKVLGGLASGFKQKNWDWYLERAYHHLFANDSDILDFAKEIGFDKIFFKTPLTASLYQNSYSNYSIYPLDTPIDLLRFPLLSFSDKIRAFATLAFLKLSPFLPFFEKETSELFLKKSMGEKGYFILFGELFRKKFGKYAKNILLSFFWARIKKRTKSLGYIEGGFQAFINYLEKLLKNLGVDILTSYEVREIKKKGNKFLINDQEFDLVISALPTPITAKIAQKIFPAKFTQNLRRLSYLSALTLILETDKPILEKTYWLNIATSKIPIMVLIQHTNFIDKKYYGGKHLAYCGWYLNKDDKLLNMNNQDLLDFILPHLKQISNFKFQIKNYYVFRAPFAQPIFDKNFLKYKHNFSTPAKNFYIASLDMTYPFDRGTNYAVKLGKEVATKILAENLR